MNRAFAASGGCDVDERKDGWMSLAASEGLGTSGFFHFIYESLAPDPQKQGIAPHGWDAGSC